MLLGKFQEAFLLTQPIVTENGFFIDFQTRDTLHLIRASNESGGAFLTLSLFTIIVAAIALLLGGFAKGISGMGLPVVTIPILTLLFDLQTAIAVTILSTLITDIIMLIRTPKSWGLIKNAAALMIFGVCGIIVGSYFLININQLILSGILGVVILIFVITSFFSLLPSFKRLPWLDAVVSLIGGTVQGAAGASGPIISMYMLQMNMSRNQFLFLINSFFVTIDLVQFITVYKLGLYKGAVAYYSLGAIVPALLALAVGLVLQKRISDKVFRNSVLLVMTLSAFILLYKSISFIL
jgi:uncharacterized protein